MLLSVILVEEQVWVVDGEDTDREIDTAYASQAGCTEKRKD